MKRSFLFSTLMTALPAFAQTAPAPATNFPANVQADLVVVQQDREALKAAFAQLKTDRAANSPNVAADRSAVALARLQLRMDLGKLHLDASPILQADATALIHRQISSVQDGPSTQPDGGAGDDKEGHGGG